MVKKTILTIFVMLLMITSVNAIEFIDNQDSNLADYYKTSNGNTLINNVAGNINEVVPVSDSNESYEYDISYEFEETNEAYYLIVQNALEENTTMRVMYRGDLNINPTLYVQNFTLREKGRYFFKFEPSNIGEVSKVWLDFEDSFASTIRYVEEKPRTFNSLVGEFVEGFTEIKDINIALWRITFYVFLFVIATGFIFGLFYIAFKIFSIAKELREKKGLMSHAIYNNKDNEDK